IAMDVSFISATLVLPAVISAAFPQSPSERSGRKMVVLVKPQFEAGREQVGKGGNVRYEAAQMADIEKVRKALLKLGCNQTDVVDSPILGAEATANFCSAAHSESSVPSVPSVVKAFLKIFCTIPSS